MLFHAGWVLQCCYMNNELNAQVSIIALYIHGISSNSENNSCINTFFRVMHDNSLHNLLTCEQPVEHNLRITHYSR